MKIKKIGHCCFVAEPKPGIRIMTDPGDFTKNSEKETDISAILITHEHGDHLHVETLRKVLATNPNAIVITNTAVGKILDGEKIAYTKVEDREIFDVKGVKIAGFGDLHAEIYEKLGQVQNTGYMIEDLCYPGDSFNLPEGKVDVLALPIAGPWVLMKTALNYAKALKPRISFPVHDAFIHDWAAFIYKWPSTVLEPENIKFQKIELNQEVDL